MKETMDFGTDKVSELFRRLFIPTVFGMLCLSALTTVDGIFVGHGVGSDGIAAVNICIPLLLVLQAIGLMAGAGCSVMASIALAHRKPRSARAFVTNAMLFVTLIALIVMLVVFICPDQVAYLLGTSDHLLPMVKDYLIWFAPSLLFQMWMMVALYIIRLDGAPRLAMWCNVVDAVLNIFLDWLFIFPLGMGVKGAAIATSLSCLGGAVVAVAYLLFFAKSIRLHRLHISGKGVSSFVRNMGEQCKVGFPAFLGEITMAMLFYVGNRVFMQYLGDDGVGAFGISCYYLPFVFMIGNAIAQSSQPLISFNYGLGSSERVQSALRVSLLTALGCGALPTVFFMACPRLLVRLFLDVNTPAAEIAIAGFPYYAIGFVAFVVNLAVIGYYQSIERTALSVFLALLRGLLFLVPSFVLLPRWLGVEGIWLALSVSEILTFVVIIFCSLRHRGAK